MAGERKRPLAQFLRRKAIYDNDDEEDE